LCIEERFLRSIPLTIEAHFTHTDVVGSSEQDLPGSQGVRIGSTVSSTDVGGRPRCNVNWLATPGHLGEQVIGKRIGIHAFRKERRSDHVRVRSSQALETLRDVNDVAPSVVRPPNSQIPPNRNGAP